MSEPSVLDWQLWRLLELSMCWEPYGKPDQETEGVLGRDNVTHGPRLICYWKPFSHITNCPDPFHFLMSTMNTTLRLMPYNNNNKKTKQQLLGLWTNQYLQTRKHCYYGQGCSVFLIHHRDPRGRRESSHGYAGQHYCAPHTLARNTAPTLQLITWSSANIGNQSQQCPQGLILSTHDLCELNSGKSLPHNPMHLYFMLRGHKMFSTGPCSRAIQT